MSEEEGKDGRYGGQRCNEDGLGVTSSKMETIGVGNLEQVKVVCFTLLSDPILCINNILP